MAAFRDEGHMIVANKPLHLGKVYRPGKLPCPVKHAGCVILINDPNDSNRIRLALSDGSSWINFVREGEVTSQAVTVRPSEIDLTPMVRAAVEAALPAMLPQPVKIINEPRQAALPDLTQLDKLREDIRMLAVANLEISEHLNPIAQKLADLMARVEFIEQNALARAELEVR